MRYPIDLVSNIPRGEKRPYVVKNLLIVVVHSEADQFYALHGWCPHQGANLCAGILSGITQAAQPGSTFEYLREGEILRCPWHGFSFDVTTGICVDEQSLRVRTYPLIITDNKIFLDL